MTYDHFGGDGYMASVVEAAFGVGMIAGSVVLMAWGGGKRLAGLIAVASLIVGVTTTACGFLAPTMFRAFVALCAVMALACSWFNGPLITLIQRNVPERRRAARWAWPWPPWDWPPPWASPSAAWPPKLWAWQRSSWRTASYALRWD